MIIDAEKLIKFGEWLEEEYTDMFADVQEGGKFDSHLNLIYSKWIMATEPESVYKMAVGFDGGDAGNE
jgi:hypothetical protein